MSLMNLEEACRACAAAIFSGQAVLTDIYDLCQFLSLWVFIPPYTHCFRGARKGLNNHL